MMKLWDLCWQTIVNWNRKLLVGYMKEIDMIVVLMVVIKKDTGQKFIKETKKWLNRMKEG